MMKFFVILPMVLLIVGVIFGIANAKGFIRLFMGWLCGAFVLVAFTVYTEYSGVALVMLILYISSIYLLPWAGTVAAFAAEPSQRPSIVSVAKEQWNGLSPEQREVAKAATIEVASVAFKAALRHGADALRKKGHLHLADGMEQIAPK